MGFDLSKRGLARLLAGLFATPLARTGPILAVGRLAAALPVTVEETAAVPLVAAAPSLAFRFFNPLKQQVARCPAWIEDAEHDLWFRGSAPVPPGAILQGVDLVRETPQGDVPLARHFLPEEEVFPEAHGGDRYELSSFRISLAPAAGMPDDQAGLSRQAASAFKAAVLSGEGLKESGVSNLPVWDPAAEPLERQHRYEASAAHAEAELREKGLEPDPPAPWRGSEYDEEGDYRDEDDEEEGEPATWPPGGLRLRDLGAILTGDGP